MPRQLRLEYEGGDLLGNIIHQSGSAAYELRRTYVNGRITELKTYRTESVPQLTTWEYDPASGFLKSKKDSQQKGASYDYDLAGRLWKRIRGA